MALDLDERAAPREIRRLASRTEGVQALDLSFRLRAEAALALLDCRPGASVIDVGCGLGAFSALLAARSLRVTCADVSPENIAAVARRHPQLATACTDAGSLPFDGGTFDAAVCMEMLEHVEDDRAALAEIRRVLRLGGLLLISVPNASAPKPLLERLPLHSVHAQEGPERHFRDGYSPDHLVQLLSAAGFTVRAATSLGGPAYRLAVGLVSLIHLGYRRLRGQPSWTWADVEADANTIPLRAYRRLFPLLLRLARVRAGEQGLRGASLMIAANAG